MAGPCWRSTRRTGWSASSRSVARRSRWTERETVMGPAVVGLRELDAGDVDLAGGKAANLGELVGAGLPVPDGFCVTTDAYREGTAAADLGVIVAQLARTGAADQDRSAALARAARDRILAVAVPAHLAAAINAASRARGGAAVAVRSSATAEDLPFASFAGQQDTYLGIVGAEAVLDAVHRYWASLWTDRAVVYRVSHGIDSAGARLAVVRSEERRVGKECRARGAAYH